MLSIRVATLDDAVGIQHIYAPHVKNSAVSFEFCPPSSGIIGMRMAGLEFQYPWLVCFYHGQLAGYAYAHSAFERPAYQWDACVAVYVDSRFARRGVGTRLYGALEKCLDAQGYLTLYACITASNTTSRAFHEKLGYESLGRWPAAGFKLGAWLDIYWYQKRLVAELPAKPTLPVPFYELPANQKEQLLQG